MMLERLALDFENFRSEMIAAIFASGGHGGNGRPRQPGDIGYINSLLLENPGLPLALPVEVFLQDIESRILKGMSNNKMNDFYVVCKTYQLARDEGISAAILWKMKHIKGEING